MTSISDSFEVSSSVKLEGVNKQLAKLDIKEKKTQDSEDRAVRAARQKQERRTAAGRRRKKKAKKRVPASEF